MAFVTRCPYCSAVWCLPSKEMAEAGPVKCSACNHSFDATCNILQVPNALFPTLTFPVEPPPELISTPQIATPPISANGLGSNSQKSHSATAGALSSGNEKSVSEKPVDDKPNLAGALAPSSLKSQEPLSAPKVDSSASQSEPAIDKRENDSFSPTKAAADQISRTRTFESLHTNLVQNNADPVRPPRVEPQSNGYSARREPVMTMHAPKKSDETAPNQRFPSIIPGKEKALPHIEVSSSDAPETQRFDAQGAKKGGGFVIFLAFLLLALLCAVGSIIFNQKILQKFPQTTALYASVCGKVPCPGYYFSDPLALIVSKTNLRPLDESGSYSVEVTLINGSSNPQALPHLAIELVDDSDATLLHRTLSPQEYLAEPERIKSIAPNQSMPLRFNIQTNVVSSRCIVTPEYPQ